MDDWAGVKLTVVEGASALVAEELWALAMTARAPVRTTVVSCILTVLLIIIKMGCDVQSEGLVQRLNGNKGQAETVSLANEGRRVGQQDQEE